MPKRRQVSGNRREDMPRDFDSSSEADFELKRKYQDETINGSVSTLRIILITAFVSGIVCASSHALVQLIESRRPQPRDQSSEAKLEPGEEVRKIREELNRRFQELDKRLAEHQLSVHTLEAQVDNVKTTNSAVMEKTEERLNTMENDFTTLRQADEGLSEATRAYHKLPSEIESVKNQCSFGLNNVNLRQTEIVTDLTELKNTIATLQNSVDHARSSLPNDLHSKMNSADIKRQEMDASISHISGRITTIEVSQAELRQSLDSLFTKERQAFNNELEENREFVASVKTNFTDMRSDIVGVQAKQRSNQGEIQNAIHRQNLLESEHSQLSTQVNNVYVELTNRIDSKMDSNTIQANIDAHCSEVLKTSRSEASDIKRTLEDSQRAQADLIDAETRRVYANLSELRNDLFANISKSLELTSVGSKPNYDKCITSKHATAIELQFQLINKSLGETVHRQVHLQEQIDIAKKDFATLGVNCASEYDRWMEELQKSQSKTHEDLMLINSQLREEIQNELSTVHTKLLTQDQIIRDVDSTKTSLQSTLDKVDTTTRTLHGKIDNVNHSLAASVDGEKQERLLALSELRQKSAKTLAAAEENVLQKIRHEQENTFKLLNDRITNAGIDEQKRIEAMRTTLQTRTEESDGKILNMRTDLLNLEQKSNTLSGQLNGVSSKQGIDADKATSMINANGKRIDKCEERLSEIPQEVKTYCDSRTEELDAKIAALSTSVQDFDSAMVDDIEAVREDINFTRAVLSGTRRTIYEITNVLVNKEPLILIIICLAIGEVIIIAFLCRRTPNRFGYSNNDWATTPEDDIKDRLWNSSSDILDKVKPRPPENAVCIVSFHRETRTTHNSLTNAVMESDMRLKGTERKQFGVTRHTDIPDIPAARLYLVFVDFNERHIILEDPSKGLGDLKLTTVRAARKMGGDVVVIYVRDGGSRELEDGQLYNSELTSIRSHRELSLLNSRQRVFSIYDCFSVYQTHHLKTIMLSTLRR
ncbi:hypothetical protein ScPMuIL_002618 [Solemya velum]